MEQVRVDDLLASPILGQRPDHLDPVKVARYAAEFEHLPPVVAFRTPDGLLLADGYHRLAAAQQLGRSTVLADVRIGTRRDALLHAVHVGATETGLDEANVLQRILGHSVDRPDRPPPEGPSPT